MYGDLTRLDIALGHSQTTGFTTLDADQSLQGMMIDAPRAGSTRAEADGTMAYDPGDYRTPAVQFNCYDTATSKALQGWNARYVTYRAYLEGTSTGKKYFEGDATLRAGWTNTPNGRMWSATLVGYGVMQVVTQ